MALPTPRTWTTGEDYTAARMNTLRDGLSSLNSFAALIAVNPATSGTATYLKITRPSGTSQILEGWVSGEAFPRIRIRPQGIGFGLGTGNPTNFLESIDLGGGVHELRMLGNFSAETMRINAGPLMFTETPGATALSFIELPNLSASPAAPENGRARIYVRTNAAGDPELAARFPDGDAQLIVAQP